MRPNVAQETVNEENVKDVPYSRYFRTRSLVVVVMKAVKGKEERKIKVHGGQSK